MANQAEPAGCWGLPPEGIACGTPFGQSSISQSMTSSFSCSPAESVAHPFASTASRYFFNNLRVCATKLTITPGIIPDLKIAIIQKDQRSLA